MSEELLRMHEIMIDQSSKIQSQALLIESQKKDPKCEDPKEPKAPADSQNLGTIEDDLQLNFSFEPNQLRSKVQKEIFENLIPLEEVGSGLEGDWKEIRVLKQEKQALMKEVISLKEKNGRLVLENRDFVRFLKIERR